jgi:hydrogenase expression/formation protein HypC
VPRDPHASGQQDEDIAPGDFVVVHGGHAVQKISAAEAHSAWALYDQLLACAQGR